MYFSASKSVSSLAVAVLFSTMLSVPARTAAQAVAPACTAGKECKKKQPGAVVVNAAPGDQSGSGNKPHGAVAVNAPAGDQPGARPVPNKKKDPLAGSPIKILARTGGSSKSNKPTCVGANCPAVQVNSADAPREKPKQKK